MKELSIEQKAKRFDEVIEKFDVILNLNTVKESGTIFADDVRKILPELKKSEDEMIRKALIKYFRNCVSLEGINGEDISNWLEKQGSQKPEKEVDNLHNHLYGDQKSADKLEPKFKVGEWCIDNEDSTIFQIVKVLDNTYTYKTNEGKEYSCTHYSLENDAKLWTIQDAKDGDVLVGGEQLFLFKRMNTSNSFYAHCNYHFIGYDNLSVYDCSYSIVNIYPATKEQRDTLEKAMADAGYTFDFEKKVLKKIEQKPTEWSWSLPYRKNETAEKLIALAECLEMDGDCLFNGLSGNDYGKFLRILAIELTEFNSAWSEEDESWFKEMELMCLNFSNDAVYRKKFSTWLKSLKDRVGNFDDSYKVEHSAAKYNKTS